ncbi:NAD(P)/FAD-dependent oxidoreductase [Spiroplasma clarkii]|uniref:NAD(P)/FAD-dependent oxidoreductase n=1 Tax=Spiroplasma clarkii TaxID=2139 RepID=UPI0016499BCF|nr:NAD(P)/FAD-dependent oxidoreductase [Spiroplasma clarkii]
MIFGGGDSAVDWANQIVTNAKSVTVIHRRDEFRAKPANLQLAAEQGVKLLAPYIFQEITKTSNDCIEKLQVANDDQVLTLEADIILVQYGQQMNKTKYKNLDLAMNEQSRILVDQTFESNITGIYAAGDCCAHPTKTRNILSSIFEAMNAIINIEKVVHHRKVLNNGW